MPRLLHPTQDRVRLFRLQWQDVQRVAERASQHLPAPAPTILRDVARFLCQLELEYFDGLRRVQGLPWLEIGDGAFYAPVPSGSQQVGRAFAAESFLGFSRVVGLDFMSTETGGWAK